MVFSHQEWINNFWTAYFGLLYGTLECLILIGCWTFQSVQLFSSKRTAEVFPGRFWPLPLQLHITSPNDYSYFIGQLINQSTNQSIFNICIRLLSMAEASITSSKMKFRN